MRTMSPARALNRGALSYPYWACAGKTEQRVTHKRIERESGAAI